MPRRLFQGVSAALEEGLSQLKGVTLLTLSGATGKGIDQLLAAAFEVRDAWSRRVTTGELNRWFERAVETNPPPAPGGKRIKLRYITQVKSRPPSFVIFGSRVDQLPESLSPLSDEFDAPRPQDRRGADAPDPARPEESVRRGAAINLNFTIWPIKLPCGTAPDHRAPRSRTLDDDNTNIVDWVHFERSRAELGSGFIRILSYFREDGVKSVAQIETAMRERTPPPWSCRRTR